MRELLALATVFTITMVGVLINLHLAFVYPGIGPVLTILGALGILGLAGMVGDKINGN